MLEIKRRSLEEIRKEVEKLRDRADRPVEPYIKELVIGLWWCGIVTESSCQGHPNRGPRCPWVDIPYYEAEKLARIVSLQNSPEFFNGNKNKNIWIIQPGPFIRLMPENRSLPLEELQKRAVEFGLRLQRLPENWLQDKYSTVKVNPSMSLFSRHAFFIFVLFSNKSSLYKSYFYL